MAWALGRYDTHHLPNKLPQCALVCPGSGIVKVAGSLLRDSVPDTDHVQSMPAALADNQPNCTMTQSCMGLHAAQLRVQRLKNIKLGAQDTTDVMLTFHLRLATFQSYLVLQPRYQKACECHAEGP